MMGLQRPGNHASQTLLMTAQLWRNATEWYLHVLKELLDVIEGSWLQMLITFK